MYIISVIVIILILYFIYNNSYLTENYLDHNPQPIYNEFIYNIALSDKRYKDQCPVEGLINESSSSCYCDYYIPNNVNRAEYESSVQPSL